MIWFLVCLAPLVAVIVRLAALRRRPEMWWLSFTLTLVGIMAGSLFLVNEAAVNQVLSVPNVSYLFSNVAFGLAGGSVTVYVHTLRHDRPSPRVVAAIVAATAIVTAVLVMLWIAAPVHETDEGSFRAIPLSPTLLASEGLFHCLFVPVLLNVAVCAAALARQTVREDPARRIGLVLIAASSSLDILAHLAYLVRAALQARIGAPALTIAAVADLITLLAVVGICAGTTALLAVPRLVHALRARTLSRSLRPLWTRTLELYPKVAMRGGWRLRSRPSLQAERMLIEIADALRLLPVPEPHGSDPYALVAEAFRHPLCRGPGDRTAADALPNPTSRLEEEDQLLQLAHHYRFTQGHRPQPDRHPSARLT